MSGSESRGGPEGKGRSAVLQAEAESNRHLLLSASGGWKEAVQAWGGARAVSCWGRGGGEVRRKREQRGPVGQAGYPENPGPSLQGCGPSCDI